MRDLTLGTFSYQVKINRPNGNVGFPQNPPTPVRLQIEMIEGHNIWGTISFLGLNVSFTGVKSNTGELFLVSDVVAKKGDLISDTPPLPLLTNITHLSKDKYQIISRDVGNGTSAISIATFTESKKKSKSESDSDSDW